MLGIDYVIESVDSKTLENDSELLELYKTEFPFPHGDEIENFLSIINPDLKIKGIILRLRIDGHTEGFITGQILDSINSTFVAYIAVSEKFRSCGFGKLLLNNIVEKSREINTNIGGVILESLPTSVAKDANEKKKYEKTINFHKRNNGIILTDQFLQPVVYPKEQIKMILFYFKFNEMIQTKDVKECMRAVYQVYNMINKVPEHVIDELLEEYR